MEFWLMIEWGQSLSDYGVLKSVHWVISNQIIVDRKEW